jgi:nitroreductase
MEFSMLIRERHSIRAYRPDPVEEEKLQEILEAARLAPTAGNQQPFQLIVVKTRGREEELRRIYRRDWFVEAPIVICACGIPEECGASREAMMRCYIDVAIVTDHLILAATNAGLGTCWIGAFDPAAAREVLGLPDGVEPVAFTTLGYAADGRRPKNRKDLSDLVRYDRW